MPLNSDYLDHEFAYAIEFSDSALVVGIGKRLEALRRVMSTLKSSVPLVDAEDLPARFPTPAQSVIAPAVKDQREALIIYTSGTTGRPKGCIISNHSCFAAGQNYASIGGRLSLEEERERLYVPLPSFHMNATILALNAVIETRGCLVMPDRFHPVGLVVRAVRHEGDGGPLPWNHPADPAEGAAPSRRNPTSCQVRSRSGGRSRSP